MPAADLLSRRFDRATGAVVATTAGFPLARGRMPRSTAPLMLGAIQIPLSLGRNPFWSQKGAARAGSLSRVKLPTPASSVAHSSFPPTAAANPPWLARIHGQKEVGQTASERLPIGDGR